MKRTLIVVCEDETVKAKIDYLHHKNLFKMQAIPSFVPMGVFSDD